MNSEAPNLQSGSISWSEAQVLNNGRKSPCGRSDHDEDHEHRARIILPVNEQVQLNLTSTATATATATDTVTFSVQVNIIILSFVFNNFSNLACHLYFFWLHLRSSYVLKMKLSPTVFQESQTPRN